MAEIAKDGVLRLAETQLRVAGGRMVLLRLAVPAVPGDDAEQLGLATPEFQDRPFGPVVFERADSITTLLVSAETVQALVGSLAYDSADVLFETAVGLAIDGVLYQIVDSTASQASGEAYCYRLTLRRPMR